jgi:hypothetical protein
MYGPGSIVNLEKISVMPSGVSAWDSYTPSISSPTFSREIGADRLIDCAALAKAGVPASLFPKTFVCRSCGTIQDRFSISAIDLKVGFRCYVDQGPLYPSRWIVYCERGHIADFNYRWFVHRTSQCGQRIHLETGASLSDTFVVCDCGARASMAEAYKKGEWLRRCSGKELWTSLESDCDKLPKLSMRSASDVYFGAVRSAITIEPESDPLVSRVFEHLAQAAITVQTNWEKAKSRLMDTKGFESVAEEDIDRALTFFFKAQHEPAEYKSRRFQEYTALARNSGSSKDDLYVETIPSTVGLQRAGIAGLYAVRKLREVRALVGFRRGGMPTDPAFDEVPGQEALASLGGGQTFPAYENRGEGVFLTLDPISLRDWLARPEVQRRVDLFAKAEDKWRTSAGGGGNHRRRGVYVLAHSLAHLMIREISLVSGYSQSSLRERIYASWDDEENLWAGVLVYTASSDADGSLGGLVAQATDGRIGPILNDAFQALEVCSSDPICALQIPVGFRKMNGAACHGCLVLPETCCERNNYFLDRTMVIPNTVHDATHALSFFPQ